MTSSKKKKEKLIRNELLISESDIHGGSKLMVTVVIVSLLKYSVEILVGNKKVGKNFGR